MDEEKVHEAHPCNLHTAGPCVCTPSTHRSVLFRTYKRSQMERPSTPFCEYLTAIVLQTLSSDNALDQFLVDYLPRR